jgi:hypothetical protein
MTFTMLRGMELRHLRYFVAVRVGDRASEQVEGNALRIYVSGL